jgi:hypothetical protein
MGNPPVPDPTLFLWFFFGLALLVTAGYAFALLYHWIRYGYMYPLVWVMMPIYLVGAVVLIGAMLGGIAGV